MQKQRSFLSLTRLGTRSVIFVAILVALIVGGLSTGQPTVLAQTNTTVVVTVTDGVNPVAGVPVYAFNGATYTNINAVTDGSGQATLSLPDGNYNFRADLNGYQYFSGGASGVDNCDVPNCTATTITVPVFGTVTVTVGDANGAVTGVPVYAFKDGVYTNRNATTDGNGQVTFTLPAGNYSFRSDVNGQQYFSGADVNDITCVVPGCTADTIAPAVFGDVTVTVSDANGAVTGVPVYAFKDGVYTNITANTDGNGQVLFTLPAGNYSFRSDVNGQQYFSGADVNDITCIVPGCTADTIAPAVFGDVTVTVGDANGAVTGVPVYAFNGAAYTNITANTDGNGQVLFTLPAGNYNFRADVNGYQYFSSGASGVDNCDVPNCTAATVDVPVFGAVAVTVNDAGNLLANQVVYVFNTSQQYLNRQASTGAAGEAALFNLPAGSYLFASDFAGSRYFSAQCDVPGCTSALVASSIDADLGIAKSVDQSSAAVDDSVIFTLVASNDGPVGATNVTVTDQLPAGLTYSSDDGNGAYDANSGVWTVGSLAANATATLHITAIVNAAAEGQSVTNSATISGDVNDTNTQNDSASALVAVGVSTICARPGTLTLPDGEQVTIWGYAPGACALGNPAQIPGPTLVASQGDVFSLTVENGLPEATSILFPGQVMRPDLVGIAPGASRTFNFTAGDAGSYLYEANAFVGGAHQLPMGLYGALVVRPAAANQAYADLNTAFDVERVLVLSEIDPALHNSANPAAFDLRNFRAAYRLINGRAYPETDEITALPGERLLLRYINAGLEYHSMAVLGLRQEIIARDGNPLRNSFPIVAETFGPGQTVDVIAQVPTSAQPQSRFALYEADMHLHNSATAGYGGMLTFVTVATPRSDDGDTVGPTITAITAAPSSSDGSVDVTITATASDVGNGDAAVQAGEYYIDNTNSTPLSLTATDGIFDSVTEAVQLTLTPAALASLSGGTHTIYLRAQDALGNWGPINSVTFRLDLGGPTTRNLSLTPNPSNAAVDVSLSATGDDSGQGGAGVTQAEFFVDIIGNPTPGSGEPLTVSPMGAPIVSLDALLSAATLASLSDGDHVVSVRSADAQGNWGDFATITLSIDQSGPTTSNVTVNPSPNNGTQPVNSSTPAVRMTASFADVMSTLERAEGFIDTVGADGSGFLFIADDGLFNSGGESGYTDIPLTTISLLSDGNHTLYAHARDIVGNWGPLSSVTLVIDRTPPTVANINIDPNPTNGADTVLVQASVADNLTGIVQAEWFIGADPGVGNGTPMTVNGSSITANVPVNTLDADIYTLAVRARDAAGNWSIVVNAILEVTQPGPPLTGLLYFSTQGNGTVTGVTGPYDDADIYNWSGAVFSRIFDANLEGLPGNANIDGLSMVSGNQFYVSFSAGNTNVPGLGNVQDEDVVYYNQGTWSVFFDGTAAGLTTTAQNVDAVSVVGGVLYFSTAGNGSIPGVSAPYDDADIYAWNGNSFTRVLDASVGGLPNNADIDGLDLIDANTFYASFEATNTTLPGLGNVQDEDVIMFSSNVWSVFFDGTSAAFTANNQDLDAVDVP